AQPSDDEPAVEPEEKGEEAVAPASTDSAGLDDNLVFLAAQNGIPLADIAAFRDNPGALRAYVSGALQRRQGEVAAEQPQQPVIPSLPKEVRANLDEDLANYIDGQSSTIAEL